MNLDITLEEVLQELDLLRAANEEVDRKLEALMEERDRLGKQLLPNGAESEQRILQAAELAKVDCRLVIDKLSRADNIAQSISGKVRRLDDAQRRLQEAMELVDEMLDLKLTIENVKEAIEEENFESAAKGTHRILSHWRKKRDLTGHSYMYDKELAEDEEAFVEEVSYETLEKLENELRVKVKFQCEKGIERIHSKSGDDGDAKLFENTINLCKLYPLLGMHREGLDSYVGLIRWKLKQKLLQQGLLLSAQPIGAVIDHLRIIPETLDCITMAIQEQNEQFQAVFGSGFQILLLKDSIRLVNEILTDVVKDFIDSKSIPKKAKLSKKIISGSRVHGPTGASQRNLERKTVESMAKKTEVDELCDPRSLDTYLEEISFICREIYLWDLEIRKAGRLALSTLKSSEDNRQALLDESEKDFSQPTPLNEICQDLIGQYITLEELYLTLNIRKALEMDEGDTDSMVSTVVDDVFFVIRKCAARSFSMLNMDSSCAVINRIAEALSKEFFTAQNYYLDEYIQAIQDASSGSSFASKLFVGSGISGVINDPLNLYKNRGISFYFLLNNLEKSSLNLSVLKDQLEVEFQRIRDQIDPEPTKLKKSTELMKNCLNELFQVAASFENLSDRGLRQISRIVLQRLTPAFESLLSCNYEISENQYSDFDMREPFSISLVAAMKQGIDHLNSVLLEQNYDRLLLLIVNHVALRIEKLILQKKFSFWGGLQLDKDVRRIISFFVESSKRSLREPFFRLNQISSLLQLEKVSEMTEYWNDGDGEVWLLSVDEVKNVLHCRPDFDSQEIESLKLPQN